MCTLFMSRLDIKERKEDLKINYKNFFLNFNGKGTYKYKQHNAQIFWTVKRKKNCSKTLFLTIGGWVINRLLIRSTLQFQTGFF